MVEEREEFVMASEIKVIWAQLDGWDVSREWLTRDSQKVALKAGEGARDRRRQGRPGLKSLDCIEIDLEQAGMERMVEK